MIELKNISYVVNENGQDKEILKNISLKFEANKITAITGQNGSGKSTLLKIIMGIISPTSGEVFFNGTNITSLDITARANSGITIAFQQPVRFKGLTIKNIIDIASQKNNDVKDACEYLSLVGLCAKEYLNRNLDDTLSGGELKRVEIALALAKGGKVFLFDEPEAGIDLWSFDELINAIKKLKNKTIIIVSHQNRILESADNIVVLSQGEQPKYINKNQFDKFLKNNSCEKLGGTNE